MGIYSRYVMPRIVHLACSARVNEAQRRAVVPQARGTVLEIGIGSGLNLPHYDPSHVTRVIGLDPSDEMLRMARRAADKTALEVRFIDLPGEEIPLADASVDTVLLTYTLCTIPDPARALRQMARVLRPGGRLLFCEHGAAPDASVRGWQDRLTPAWSRLGGGCRLNREIPHIIESNGFRVVDLEAGYVPGWRPVSYNYRGAAEHASPGAPAAAGAAP